MTTEVMVLRRGGNAKGWRWWLLVCKGNRRRTSGIQGHTPYDSGQCMGERYGRQLRTLIFYRKIYRGERRKFVAAGYGWLHLDLSEVSCFLFGQFHDCALIRRKWEGRNLVSTQSRAYRRSWGEIRRRWATTRWGLWCPHKGRAVWSSESTRSRLARAHSNGRRPPDVRMCSPPPEVSAPVDGGTCTRRIGTVERPPPTEEDRLTGEEIGGCLQAFELADHN